MDTNNFTFPFHLSHKIEKNSVVSWLQNYKRLLFILKNTKKYKYIFLEIKLKKKKKTLTFYNNKK